MPAQINQRSVDGTFRALADPARRDVVELLSTGPMCPSDLAEATGVSPQSMSRHLRVLKRAELVCERINPSDARIRIYELRRDGFADLGDWLGVVEAFWTDQLVSFKRHVEAKAGKSD